MSDAPHRSRPSGPPAVDVLVASRDRNFLTLARAVLRAAGHHVVTTSVRSERVQRQVRLRGPRVLLLEADPETVQLVRIAAAATGTTVLRITDDPGAEAAADETPSAVHKWGPPAHLLTAVDEVLSGPAVQNTPRAGLRLVQQ